MPAERPGIRSRRMGTGAGFALVLTLVVLYAPVVQLVVSSVNRNALTTRWKGFTTEWYSLALDNEQVRQAALRSLWLALSVAVSAGVVGSLAAIVVRHHRRARVLLQGLAAARIATPELVLAVALGVVLPLLDVRFGPVTMWFGHTVLLSAYVLLVVGTRLSGMPAGLEEAAADLGAPPLRVVRLVVVPHVLPAVAAAALLVAAFSFDDVLLSARLGGPQDTTLPLVILSMATRRTTPELDAIGSLVVAAGAVAFLAALALGRVRSSHAREVLLAGGRQGARVNPP